LERPVAMKNSVPLAALTVAACSRLSAEQYPASASTSPGACPAFTVVCSVIGIRLATSAAQSVTSAATIT
jgi:hypothetical protein